MLPLQSVSLKPLIFAPPADQRISACSENEVDNLSTVPVKGGSSRLSTVALCERFLRMAAKEENIRHMVSQRMGSSGNLNSDGERMGKGWGEAFGYLGIWVFLFDEGYMFVLTGQLSGGSVVCGLLHSRHLARQLVHAQPQRLGPACLFARLFAQPLRLFGVVRSLAGTGGQGS